MKTYLKVVFSSEGEKPSAIYDALKGIGFLASKGKYDFEYTWPQEDGTVDEILHFANMVHAELLGMGVYFEMETI